MKTILFVLLLLFFSLSILIKAQPTFDPQLVLEKEINFGGDGDNIFAAIPVNDAYIISGTKFVRDGGTWKEYAKIMKLDKYGTPVWEYTDAESTLTMWNALAPAPDGVFWGVSGDEESSILPYISKIDNNGDFVWTKYLEQEFVNAIASNDEFLVTLQGRNGLKVSVFNLDGELMLDPWYIPLDVSYGLIVKDSSLYILGDNGGGIETNVHADIFKTDLAGNVIWQDSLIDVHGLKGDIDLNGDLFVSGLYYTGNGRSYYRTVKYDTDTGARIWEKLWDGDNSAINNNTTVQSVIAHPNGGVVVVGYLAKIGQNDPNALEGGSIAYDSNGNVYFKMRYDYRPEWYRSNFQASLFDNDNSLVIFGSTWNFDPNTPQALFVTKWDNVTGIEDEPYAIPSEFSLSQNYPNPFNPSTTINFTLLATANVTLKVYDVLGEEIDVLVSEAKPAGMYSVEFNATDLPSGIYFYRINAGAYTVTKKMVLLR